MDSRRVGRHALLVECASATAVVPTLTALRALLADAGVAVGELVPAARTVLLDGLTDAAAVADLVSRCEAPAAGASIADGPVVEIPVRYDGPDLAEVARQWQVDEAEVVRIHRGCVFTVQFCGFAPGFAYCTGLPDGFETARRESPRSRVPAGSVALAGEYTSIYPGASPGGWQLIGTTDLALWRPDLERPALLQPGTTVRFVDG